jgi:predicted glutamine amidotransferase
MCIIVVGNPKEIWKNSEALERIKYQGDGFGIAWLEDNWNIYKTLDFNKFLNFYKEHILKQRIKKVFIHGRMATQGAENLTNCHPVLPDESDDTLDDEILLINIEEALIHNGVISLPEEIIKTDPKYVEREVIYKKNSTSYWEDLLTQEVYRHKIISTYFSDTKLFLKSLRDLPLNKKLKKIEEEGNKGNKFVYLYKRNFYIFGEWYWKNNILSSQPISLRYNW